MSSIYTKTGDDGTTGLTNGRRLPKQSVRIDTLGNVDELNAALGVLIASATSLKQILEPVQHHLFLLGAELATPGSTYIDHQRIEKLETAIDLLDAKLPPLVHFILPGGSQPAALAHLARTICRRAERNLVRLSQDEQVNSASIIYLNRLSDLLFVVARSLARADGGEIPWNKET